MEFHQPPAQPHISIFNMGNPAGFKAAGTNPFAWHLAPEDLDRLAADPAKRVRWIELGTHTMVPPLRELVPIIRSKVSSI
jgi:hypothetical protein